ncbi:MAG: ABC transporter substrate-binding protein, partial [bacterium]|nr:ABC transporter substrate-binding protein [bacterium]
MRRRRFLGLLGGSVVAWPMAVRAQAKLPVIGILLPANPEPTSTWIREALRDVGYVDGKNVR